MGLYMLKRYHPMFIITSGLIGESIRKRVENSNGPNSAQNCRALYCMPPNKRQKLEISPKTYFVDTQ